MNTKVLYLTLHQNSPSKSQPNIDQFASSIKEIINETIQKQFNGQAEVVDYQIQRITSQGAEVVYYYRQYNKGVSADIIIAVLDWIKSNWQVALGIIATLSAFLILLSQLNLSLTISDGQNTYRFTPQNNQNNGSGGGNNDYTGNQTTGGLETTAILMWGLIFYLLYKLFLK